MIQKKNDIYYEIKMRIFDLLNIDEKGNTIFHDGYIIQNIYH